MTFSKNKHMTDRLSSLLISRKNISGFDVKTTPKIKFKELFLETG